MSTVADTFPHAFCKSIFVEIDEFDEEYFLFFYLFYIWIRESLS